MTSKKIKMEDAAQVAEDAAEDAARDAKPGIVPLVGMPDIAEAVALAEQIVDSQGGVSVDVLAIEDIYTQVYAQQRVLVLAGTLGDLLKAHPELAGLSPAQRGAGIIDPKLDTARALRKLIREEIMVRVGALVRAEIARRGGERAR